MPSRDPLTSAEGELVLSLLEQPNCRIVGSAVDELGFDAARLVGAGILQPIGLRLSVFPKDGTEGGFRDLERIDGPQPAYFDAADGMVVPPLSAITLYRLDLGWWLSWLADALRLVGAGRPTELVPDHAWDLGNLWVTDRTKVPVMLARRIRCGETRNRLSLALDKRKGRSGGILLTTSHRDIESTPWAGGHHLQPLRDALTSSADDTFEVDLEIIRSPYMPGHPARPEAPIGLSPDNRLLTICGQEMVFGGHKQQLVLRRLVDAYQRGESVRATELFAHFADGVDTPLKAFKGSPNWVHLKNYIKQERGMVSIQI